MNDWITFWDSPHAIYVNAHHRDVHYRRIAEDVLRYMRANTRALDYGCGEALHADIPAKVAQQLLLCEAAPKLRESLAARYAGDPKIQVVSPEQVEALGNHSLDLIVMHSVAQYLTGEELDKLIVLFHRLLKEDGLFVLGDVIPPQVSALTDALALLRFGREEGFFFAALFGLVRTVFSKYWDLRSTLGLTRYDKDEMLRKLTAAGFWAAQGPKNIGHNQARMTFLGRLEPSHLDH
jgi:SAM-dependent methyltransferase